MKLQASPVHELLRELLIRLQQQGKEELIGGDVTLNEIMEEMAIDPVIFFAQFPKGEG